MKINTMWWEQLTVPAALHDEFTTAFICFFSFQLWIEVTKTVEKKMEWEAIDWLDKNIVNLCQILFSYPDSKYKAALKSYINTGPHLTERSHPVHDSHSPTLASSYYSNVKLATIRQKCFLKNKIKLSQCSKMLRTKLHVCNETKRVKNHCLQTLLLPYHFGLTQVRSKRASCVVFAAYCQVGETES